MSSTRSKIGITARQWFIFFAGVAPLAVLGLAVWWRWDALWLLILVGLIVIVGVYDMTQRNHSILRVYPVLGHGRFLAERIRPEIQQYFVESDINGTPFNREIRSVVYQRAKHEADALPFGTQRTCTNPATSACHTAWRLTDPAEEPRVVIGGPECRRPYAASISTSRR